MKLIRASDAAHKKINKARRFDNESGKMETIGQALDRLLGVKEQ